MVRATSHPTVERTVMNPENTTVNEQADESVTVEALIEEVSIDGMCGVY
jgi:mycofactocin precursor